jgi:hypothetical protein
MGAIAFKKNLSIVFLLAIGSTLLLNTTVAQPLVQRNKDHKLWLAKVELMNKSIRYGFVDQIHQNSISIIEDLTQTNNPSPTTIEATQIKSITYHHYGDFSDTFRGTMIPIVSFATAAAMPEIDYWGGLIIGVAIVYGTPIAAVMGGISHTREKQKRFELEGSANKFNEHLTKINIKTPLPVDHIRLTEKGKKWYREITGEMSYYPITYKPVLHFFLGAGQTLNSTQSHGNNFFSRFEQTYSYQSNTPTGLGGMGISFGDRIEAGFTINSGSYISQSWEFTDNEDNYFYDEYYDTDLTTFYLLYHVTPYEPISNPFQVSLGAGLSYYTGYYSQYLIGSNNTQNRVSSDNSGDLEQLGVDFIARGEAFLSSRYSIVLQADYNLNLARNANEVSLRSPYRTDPITSQFNISSLTISTGIRLHY